MTQERPGGAQASTEELQAWIKQRLDAAVQEITERGLMDSVVLEARPAWFLPFSLLIGQVREHGRGQGFDWFICGDGPTTLAHSTVAASPREAARHFALQWQLTAARQGSGESELSQRAGALYELVEDAAFWQT